MHKSHRRALRAEGYSAHSPAENLPMQKTRAAVDMPDSGRCVFRCCKESSLFKTKIHRINKKDTRKKHCFD